MDWIPWIVRAILIAVGVALVIVISKGRKNGKYQQVSLRFFVIGITALTLGLALWLVSLFSGLVFGYEVFLIVTGAVIVVVGLVIRNIWERRKSREK